MSKLIPSSSFGSCLSEFNDNINQKLSDAEAIFYTALEEFKMSSFVDSNHKAFPY
jgi:hypothetical protein